MKKLLPILLLFISTFSTYGQRAVFGQLNKNNASFKEYQTKSGDLLKIGDTLVFGTATSSEGFVYINQANMKVHPTHSGKKVPIHKIKSYGNDKTGYTVWISVKGFGLYPVDIDYENALLNGEIINPNGKLTKQQAIQLLKEKKELLDLEIISQEEYDKIKNELTPIIRE